MRKPFAMPAGYDRWKTRSPDDEENYREQDNEQVCEPRPIRRPDVWLELTKADSINGEDQKTYVNFSQVIEITPMPLRNVTVLLFSAGFRTEVKEDAEAILRSLEGGAR